MFLYVEFGNCSRFFTQRYVHTHSSLLYTVTSRIFSELNSVCSCIHSLKKRLLQICRDVCSLTIIFSSSSSNWAIEKVMCHDARREISLECLKRKHV